MSRVLAECGVIYSINISDGRGTLKSPVECVELVSGKGIKGDGHYSFGHRQVSLLMLEDIEAQKKMFREKGIKGIEPGPGVFAENFTTKGVDLTGLKIGDELITDKGIVLRVSQIGKVCHTRCSVYSLVGECIMPERGVFCEVIIGGKVRVGDGIRKRG